MFQTQIYIIICIHLIEVGNFISHISHTHTHMKIYHLFHPQLMRANCREMHLMQNCWIGIRKWNILNSERKLILKKQKQILLKDTDAITIKTNIFFNVNLIKFNSQQRKRILFYDNDATFASHPSHFSIVNKI